MLMQIHFINQMPWRLALQEFITIYQSWICLCEDPATTKAVLSMGLLIQNINRAWVMVCTTAQAEFHPFNCMTGHLVLLLPPLCMSIIMSALRSKRAHWQNLPSLNLPYNIQKELLDNAVTYSSISYYRILHIIFSHNLGWSVCVWLGSSAQKFICS